MVSVCLCVSQRGVTVGKRLLQPQGYVTTSTYMLSVYITPLWMCVFQISATALSVSVSKRKIGLYLTVSTAVMYTVYKSCTLQCVFPLAPLESDKFVLHLGVKTL